MTKKKTNLDNLVKRMNAVAPLWDRIHRLAKNGGKLTLTPSDVQQLADWGSLAATLAQFSRQVTQRYVDNSVAVEERIHWHHVALKVPGDERMVSIRDTTGNISQGFYNEMIEVWQTRYPTKIKSQPTHWAEIKGPEHTTPLNAFKPSGN